MLNDKGYEVPDPVPLAKLFNVTAEETLAEKIKRMVRLELSQQVKEIAETWEEADDFDVGDDPELSSPYELFDEGYNEQETAQADAGKPVPASGRDDGPAGGPNEADDGNERRGGERSDGAGAGDAPKSV